MWPFIIAGFIVLWGLALLFAGHWWNRPREGRRLSGEGAIHTNTITPPSVESGPNWWERNVGVQRAVGALLAVGGLWHAAAPWINGYSNVPAAVASDLASGLILVAVGVAFIALRGGAWLTWAAAAVGAWVLIAPQILGFGGPRLAENEAVWGGLATIVLAVLAGLERRLGRDEGSAPIGTQS